MLFSCLEAGWQDRKAEGWAWYEDKEPKEEATNKKSPPKTPGDELDLAKKNLDEKLAKALLYPTEGNLKEYMEVQKKWLDQSSKFSQEWLKILLKYPNLDPTITNPVTQYGIQLEKNLEQERKTKLIQDLAKENGLFFFYEGKNKASQAVAIVAIEFAKRYGWELVPISLDGILLPEFPLGRVDQGIAKQMEVTVSPSLYIVNPKSKHATPIAYGLVTLDQIEKNIGIQYQETNN